MQRVQKPGYKCPLCPDHQDDTFVDSKVVEAPICEGCDFELSIFLELETRPHDKVIGRLEQVTGKSFEECKELWIDEVIERFQFFLKPENLQKKRPRNKHSPAEPLKRLCSIGGRQLTTISDLKKRINDCAGANELKIHCFR